ncbi:YwiC-like family protein [Austwickia chelonae]|uniref:YwiC-like family protein n=1 Tax=Austwickia chelonae TaxID=100225 RepID=UPI000E267112|nr:YwiC-like family protein [Austwickia chelonae]
MSSPLGAVTTPRKKRRRSIPAYWLPRQHGAWAMLAVPALVGGLRHGWGLLQTLLLLLLFSGYFLFNATGLALRSRKGARHRAAMVTYTAISAPFAVALLVLDPGLLRWLPIYLPLALGSLFFSWKRRDRALANDAITILAACLYAAVMACAHDRPGDPVQVTAWVVTVLFAYFFGTALYVKTLIRERTNPGFHRVSIGYHALCPLLFWTISQVLAIPASALLQGLTTAFFVALAVRAWAMAGRRVRPMFVGLGEIGASAVLLALLLCW